MEAYVQKMQKDYDIRVSVLRCCIKAGSVTGYCHTCLENFRYRNGKYYEGFEYTTDDDLLNRVASGMKAWGTFGRSEIDEELEDGIQALGLYIVSVKENRYGALCYEVIKDKGLRLSDLADIETIGNILNFPIPDRRLVDIDLDIEPDVIKGIVYGYPFYTLLPLMYVRDPSKELEDEPLEVLLKLLFTNP